MKLAVIFHGLSSGKNDKGDEVLSIRAIESILKTFSSQNVDYFFHTWGASNEILLKKLKPKNWKFEEPISTQYTGSKIHSTLSRFTSLQKSMSVFNDYRLRSGMNYNAALIIRFDLLVYGKIMPKKIQGGSIDFPFWGNRLGRKIGYLDYYFIVGEEHFTKFDEIVQFAENYIEKNNITIETDRQLSNHRLLKEFINTLDGKVSFTGREHRDFCLDKHFKGYTTKSGVVNFYLSKQLILYILSAVHLEYPLKFIYGVIKRYAYFNR